MNVSVIATPNFEREAKKLIRKYRSLKIELAQLISALDEDPRKGKSIAENVFKIRVAVKSKGKGKSGGLRIITYVEAEVVEKEEIIEVFLLSIYNKSDYENVSDSFIKGLIEDVLEGTIDNDPSEERG